MQKKSYQHQYYRISETDKHKRSKYKYLTILKKVVSIII